MVTFDSDLGPPLSANYNRFHASCRWLPFTARFPISALVIRNGLRLTFIVGVPPGTCFQVDRLWLCDPQQPDLLKTHLVHASSALFPLLASPLRAIGNHIAQQVFELQLRQ